MEYALWEVWKTFLKLNKNRCLNPYSNGICSISGHGGGRSFDPDSVLILILMEYTLWGPAAWHQVLWWHLVLILILMEYTLWVFVSLMLIIRLSGSLNPYSNGIYSMRWTTSSWPCCALCLNPYSNGIYSMSKIKVARDGYIYPS